MQHPVHRFSNFAIAVGLTSVRLRVAVGGYLAAASENNKARRTEVLRAKLGVGARHALFPVRLRWAPRFRGPQAPRRHSSRQAKVSVSWRDRNGRFRLLFFE